MKEKITQKAAELFINLGFKSVTMDDIANEMGISKKTIYSHFKNKTELVDDVMTNLFEEISCGIDKIRIADKNPIEELYEIKKLVLEHLKDEKTSPQHQLQKYYPQTFTKLKHLHYNKMQNCAVENLEKGISQGLYRKNLNVEFVARIYFIGVNGIKDDTVFPIHLFPKVLLMDDFLEYHLRGIATKEGLNILNNFIKTNQTNEV